MEPKDNDAALIAGLRPEFTPQLLNEKGIETSAAVRRVYSEALTKLEALLPVAGRERSLMITALQESSMWAIRATSQDPSNTGTR